MYEEFSYVNLSVNLSVLKDKVERIYGDYRVSSSIGLEDDGVSETVFFELHCNVNRRLTTQELRGLHRMRQMKGWKFHISLDDQIDGNVGRGWDIVKDVLLNHQVAMSKVVRPGVILSDINPDQRGKQITIYAWRNPEKDPEAWRAILGEITSELTREQVVPGYRCVSSHRGEERTFVGNSYITYRYEGRGSPTSDPYVSYDFSDIHGQGNPKEWVGLGQQV